MPQSNTVDNVNHPVHYARFRVTIEPKDLTKFLPHPLASAIEYIMRAPFKGSEIEDLKKAVFWLRELLNTSELWSENQDGEIQLNILSKSLTQVRMAALAMGMKNKIVAEIFGGSEARLPSDSDIEPAFERVEAIIDSKSKTRHEDQES